MSFEAEVIPLFIIGCSIVSLAELAVGLFLLHDRKRARGLFLGHVLSMAIGLFFLVRCIFGSRLGLTGGIVSIDHSVSIGLFGLFWMLSVMFMLAALGCEESKTGR